VRGEEGWRGGGGGTLGVRGGGGGGAGISSCEHGKVPVFSVKGRTVFN